MTTTIYSNCMGTFVFKDKKLVDEALFKTADIAEQVKRIESGQELDSEASMAKKHKGAEILPRQKTPPDWIIEQFNKKKYLELLRAASLVITKRKIAAALKPDHLIVQAVNNVDEIDKVVNNLAKRLREWYELYNPEFSRSLDSHQKFAELIQKKTKEQLQKEIGISSSESMGAELENKDIEPIMALAAQITSLSSLRDAQARYIEKAMKDNMPNTAEVCGPMIGGKLLSIAGSLERLALFPASTIQLLGAEKALFRHIKTGSKPPKFGVIINHPIVTKTKQSEKGKAARMLADKISIAAKIDFFKGEFRGDKLRKEVEARFG